MDRRMLNTDELDRLKSLLKRFDLLPYQDQILGRAAPCIAMMLADPHEGDESWPPLSPGISKVGGFPDLPKNLNWPMHDGHRAGFYLQICLSELPRTAWNPWPTHGMVYLFCHSDEGTYFNPPTWELVYWRGPMEALKPTRPPLAPLSLEVDFFANSIARRLKFRLGTDFPPGSSSEWNDFVYPLQELGRAHGDEDVLTRFFDFREIAIDPHVESDLAKGRGHFFYPVGRLFGHTDTSLRDQLAESEREAPEHSEPGSTPKERSAIAVSANAAWRQIMCLISNPVVSYMSPSDASPTYIMTKDPGMRPWMPSSKVYGLASK
jgi:hypothetical protein